MWRKGVARKIIYLSFRATNQPCQSHGLEQDAYRSYWR